MDHAQITGMWIDFIMLLSLSYYLRVYKLPMNCSIIPGLTKNAIKVYLADENAKNGGESAREAIEDPEEKDK